MTEKNTPQQPDQVPPHVDVPTFQAPSESAGYRQAGRVAPQEIRPVDDAPTTIFPATNSREPLSFDTAVSPAVEPPVATVPAAAATPVDTQPTTTIPVVHDTGDGYVETTEEIPATAPEPVGRRGTIDFGLFLLRVFLGALLIFNAAATLFNLGDNSIAALTDEFANYHYPEVLAFALPILQLAAGVFLILGLLTPLAAALAVLATAFMGLHAIAHSAAPGNVLLWEDGVWLAIVIAMVAVAVQFTGPGRISADFSRGWARRPLASSWVFFLIGAGAAAALWWFTAGANPLMGVTP